MNSGVASFAAEWSRSVLNMKEGHEEAGTRGQVYKQALSPTEVYLCECMCVLFRKRMGCGQEDRSTNGSDSKNLYNCFGF